MSEQDEETAEIIRGIIRRDCDHVSFLREPERLALLRAAQRLGRKLDRSIRFFSVWSAVEGYSAHVGTYQKLTAAGFKFDSYKLMNSASPPTPEGAVWVGTGICSEFEDWSDIGAWADGTGLLELKLTRANGDCVAWSAGPSFGYSSPVETTPSGEANENPLVETKI